ncbi:Lrp/AsnC family transcriptional regulator [Streptomyces thermocarboxydus]
MREDGRTQVSVLARRLDRAESSVARAMDRLISRGVLQFRTLVDPSLLGFDAEFMVWLSIEPGKLEAAGRQLARHPGTKFLAPPAGASTSSDTWCCPGAPTCTRTPARSSGRCPG